VGWVDDAAELPVAFAQVREDPLLDLEAIARAGGNARVVMVASGGCTAAFLAGSGTVSHLLLVDPNPSQIALTRLKLHLLAHAWREERAVLLGHRSDAGTGTRGPRLAAAAEAAKVSLDELGPRHLITGAGPDEAGRYEQLFSHFRGELRSRGQGSTVLALFGMTDLEEQRAAVRAPAFSTALRESCDATFDFDVLVKLFGKNATGNARIAFAEHFRERFHTGLSSLRAMDNPWMRSLLLGASAAAGEPPPWIALPLRTTLPPIDLEISRMETVLAALPPGSVDVVQLSNILDWLDPPAAVAMLDLAARALRRGGIVIVRQLNSTLDVASLGGKIDWDAGWGARLHERDRSFFYRAIHVGRRA